MMQNKKKSWFIIGYTVLLAIAMGCYVYGQYSYRKTDGFSAAAIQFDIPRDEKWEIPRLSDNEKHDLDVLLQQKFTYLGKGARSYAFVSDDGDYVLKFFKFRYHKPHWTVRYLPPIPPFEYFRQKKIRKVSLDTVLTGYSNAYDVDREGTGLIYIHLNLTKGQLYPITVTDKAGNTHTIDLDRTRFVVQKKVKELSDVLSELLASGQVDLAKERLIQTLDLYLKHYEMGIFDLGVGITKNNGFIGDQPVHFDVGKMTRNDAIRDPEHKSEAIRVMRRKAEEWVQKKFPHYYDEIAFSLRKRYGE